MASTANNTLTEKKPVELYKTQMQIERPIWDEMKIQAVREGVTAGQLATKAYRYYLESVKASHQ